MSDLCKCTFAIRMNGDGCRHCQPQGYIDRLEDQAKDHSDRIERLEAVLVQAQGALELIASQKRPDGTWNRDREACRDLAAKTLAKLQDWSA